MAQRSPAAKAGWAVLIVMVVIGWFIVSLFSRSNSTPEPESRPVIQHFVLPETTGDEKFGGTWEVNPEVTVETQGAGDLIPGGGRHTEIPGGGTTNTTLAFSVP